MQLALLREDVLPPQPALAFRSAFAIPSASWGAARGREEGAGAQCPFLALKLSHLAS